MTGDASPHPGDKVERKELSTNRTHSREDTLMALDPEEHDGGASYQETSSGE